MGHGGSLRGVVGSITWRCYTAAAINGYRVTRSAAGAWRLRALVVTADSFKLKQEPLVFVAPHATGAWCWPIRSVEWTTEQGTWPKEITATLDPPFP